MQKLFTKILVPVIFNRNTGLALDKATQLANHFGCDVHLVHVQASVTSIPFLSHRFFAGSFIRSTTSDSSDRLRGIEASYKLKLKDGLLMTSSLVSGSWQSALKEAVIAEHIDLVIIPRSHTKFGNALIQRVDLNKLSQQAQCPVLTVTRSFNIKRLLNIVVPVNDSLPVRKLSLATYMCCQAHGSIHLMGSGGNSPDGREKRRFLIKAYQLLSDYGHIKIHCTLPEQYDNPASTLSYARDIKADLIVVNTGKESLLRGWWNKLLGKCIYRQSDIPVLTIAPQQDQIQLTLN